MRKYLEINLNFLNKLVILLLSLNLFGQTIDKPSLGFTSACASDGFNNFTYSFIYRNGIFPADNQFVVLMSDGTGDFTNAIEIDRISNANFTPLTTISGSFSISNGTYGTNFRIRIEATNPNTVSSPDSDSFEAYSITSDQLILNNFETDVVLCDGVSQSISLNEIDPNFDYIWYRDGNPIPSQTGLSITVSEPGEYYAEINYGNCTEVVVSNKVFARIINTASFSIEGDDTVALCSDETYDLIASIDDPSFVYKWFKDGEQLTGLPEYTPIYTIPSSNQFGVYHVEIEVSGCSSRSQDVTIEQKSNTEITAVIEPQPSPRVILPGENLVLSVVHNASETATIKWFRDGTEIPGVVGSPINASSPGVYVAEVTDASGSCAVSGLSEEYEVLEILSLEPTIRTDQNYQACAVSSVTLSIVGIKAEASDGNTYDLSQDQINLLQTEWYKDGVAISGATDPVLTIGSFTENGAYLLNVFRSSLTANSNTLDVLLQQELEIISSSASNTLCPGEPITLSLSKPLTSGFTYKWFKDDVEIMVSDPSSITINEIGVYYVQYEGFGCQVNTAQVEVLEFDENILEVSPATNAVLAPGQTVTLVASGADSYEWYNALGDVLSTNESLTVSVLGTYTVVGFVGSCSAQREINVIEDDQNVIIPNIITPFNGDGINDTWEIPNRFAFQPNVQVIIYNSRGQEVLNTTDYQNNWPLDNNLKDGMLFYFKVIRENTLIKAGTISVLQ